MNAPLSARALVLAASVAGWLFAGMQLGLMPIAARSISLDFMGVAATEKWIGDWFARYNAALMLGAAIGGILLGQVGDRFGRRTGLAWSVIFLSAFSGLAYFATNQWQMCALRFLVGLGVGGAWPNGVALLAEFWPKLSRPTIAGIFGMAANLGVVCMSRLGAFKPITPNSWRWLMIAGALPVLAGLLTYWLAPESPSWLQTRVEGGQERRRKSSLSQLFQPPLRRLTIIGICLAAIPLIGAWSASKWMIPWADRVGQAVGRNDYKATVQLWWGLGAVTGSLVGAHLANLLGRRLTYFLISLASAAITSSVFLLMKPLAPSFLPAVFIQGLVATVFFGWLPLYLPELFPTEVRATGAGLTYNFGRFATAGGVLCAGGLMRLLGDYARVGAVTGLVYALGMIVILFAPDTTKKALE